jgi:hypothetical protein
MAELSIDAMRLAGRLAATAGVITWPRIKKICEKKYDLERTPQDFVAELVAYGYLVQLTRETWKRTQMPYTKELSLTLMTAVQVLRRRQKTDVVNIVRKDIDPVIAEWFGYPQHPVRLTGRVYYLKDDE